MRKRKFNLLSQDLILDTISSVTASLSLMLGGIAAISLLVGGIGIMNIMLVSVTERTREIGIMKAIGAKNSDIMWIFLIESGLLGLVGGIVGALMGLGGAMLVSNLANQALGSDLFIISINYSSFTWGCCIFIFCWNYFWCSSCNASF